MRTAEIPADVAELLSHPSLIYQLKRSLGNDHMSLTEAVRQAIDQAIKVRSLQTALHDTIVAKGDTIPESARRHIQPNEMRYAEIRLL